MSEQALYTDGGVILRNPSSIGGTWAWCLVEGNEIVASSQGGEILPSNGRWLTNNVMEYFAVIQALGSLPNGWSGHLYSDSGVTLGRVFQGWKMNGIPREFFDQMNRLLGRLGTITPILLQGHPTKADLERGIGAKRNLPVSKWNVWCDQECQRQAKEYLERMKG